MKLQRIAVAITIINLVLMVVLLAKINPVTAQKEENRLQVIHGSGLEIIDSSGQLRASITLQPSSDKDGVSYPGGILLRLIDSKGQPVVKIGGFEDGGGLSFSNESNGYIQVIARESGGFLKIKDPNGKEQLVKP